MPSPASSNRSIPGRVPRYFTQEEVRRFFAVIGRLRDRVLFILIYHHGLRVGEVALLCCGDVDLERSRILVRRLKGGMVSEQVLLASTRELLRRYLPVDVDRARPLFCGQRGSLRKRRVQALFANFRTSAGLRVDLTCHSLRHAIATHLLDADVSLEVIQDRLGHQSPRSTSWYARVTSHHRAAVFRELESSPWIVQPTPSPPIHQAPEA